MANQAKEPQTKTPKEPSQTSEPKKVELTQDQFNAIMERMNKLENSQTVVEKPAQPTPGTDASGRPVGIIQKYSIDPAHYHDPRPALAALKELERFAFASNFMLDWEVDQTIYETKYGTSFSEPKFKLTLYRRMFDDDGNLTDKRIVVGRATFFEDPAAAIKIATELGIDIDPTTSAEFLEQMRLKRYTAWLIDMFNPPKRASARSKSDLQVIAGKVYEVEEYQQVL